MKRVELLRRCWDGIGGWCGVEQRTVAKRGQVGSRRTAGLKSTWVPSVGNRGFSSTHKYDEYDRWCKVLGSWEAPYEMHQVSSWPAVVVSM